MSRGACVSIGKRLKEARLAANYRSQGDLADAIGIKRESQNRFESGRQTPGGEYFSKIADAGLDVLYVITGVSTMLSTEEAVLLDNFRAACAEQQEQLLNASRALASSASDTKRKAIGE